MLVPKNQHQLVLDLAECILDGMDWKDTAQLAREAIIADLSDRDRMELVDIAQENGFDDSHFCED